jgi:hypothetical protein
MSLFEILLFILGAAFLIVSFFVGNNSGEETDDREAFLFPKEELDKANREISEEISRTSENTLIDAENKLSKMSNETILFVDDFAKQTLERIQHNHDEVVFMYNMLQTKEEELKTAERNLAFESERVEQQKKELEAMLSPRVPEESGIEMARRKSSAEKQAKKAAQEVRPAVMENEPILTDASEFAGDEEENTTQKILALYKQNRSVLDISKQLGIGQGEVKLVIDLYGRG